MVQSPFPRGNTVCFTCHKSIPMWPMRKRPRWGDMCCCERKQDNKVPYMPESSIWAWIVVGRGLWFRTWTTWEMEEVLYILFNLGASWVSISKSVGQQCHHVSDSVFFVQVVKINFEHSRRTGNRRSTQTRGQSCCQTVTKFLKCTRKSRIQLKPTPNNTCVLLCFNIWILHCPKYKW